MMVGAFQLSAGSETPVFSFEIPPNSSLEKIDITSIAITIAKSIPTRSVRYSNDSHECE